MRGAPDRAPTARWGWPPRSRRGARGAPGLAVAEGPGRAAAASALVAPDGAPPAGADLDALARRVDAGGALLALAPADPPAAGALAGTALERARVLPLAADPHED